MCRDSVKRLNWPPWPVERLFQHRLRARERLRPVIEFPGQRDLFQIIAMPDREIRILNRQFGRPDSSPPENSVYSDLISSANTPIDQPSLTIWCMNATAA